ncbi:DUF2563 family protein [Mycolicibacterium flavescens]|nr:DUF2563 family protein [Mycolicibacterium flavescens]MCV7282840.1 DUF2563 family protein [Mycolicibacterium flavescens]
MRVDPTLLRMGADFSESAGAIVHQGAGDLTSASLPASAFGDFDEAKTFHQALSEAHAKHAATMQGHHSALMKLAENAVAAARAFTETDEYGATTIEPSLPGLTV